MPVIFCSLSFADYVLLVQVNTLLNPLYFLKKSSWLLTLYQIQVQSLWQDKSSVQFSHSVTSNSLRPHEPQHARPPPTPGVHPNPRPLSRWCHPTVSSCRSLLLLSSIFPSIRVFSNESALCIRWPKYWSFSFNVSPSNEHPGLISFRMDWLDLLVVQGTLKSLLQHHSSKAFSLTMFPKYLNSLRFLNFAFRSVKTFLLFSC